MFTASILDGFSLFRVESRPTNGERLVTCDPPWGIRHGAQIPNVGQKIAISPSRETYHFDSHHTIGLNATIKASDVEPRPRKSGDHQTEGMGFTISGYSICSARAEHISALSAIELAAAQLLRGYVPESVLAETTDERSFADAARDGRLWVASTGNTPVGFALVKMLADDLPISKRLTSTRLTGATAWARLSSGRCAIGRAPPGTPC